MPLFNNNDREESKPTSLNKIQKRLCTRTVRGWEIPLMGSFFDYGVTGVSSSSSNALAYTNGVVYTELLVAMPIDDSTSASFTTRSGPTATSAGQGQTAGIDVPNYAPYFSCPFNGDSATAGGMAGAGVSHGLFTYVHGARADGGLTPGPGYGYQWSMDKYGVSSLGGLSGVTAYVKVVVNDANFTNTITIGLSGTNTGCTLHTGTAILNNATLVPVAVMESFFGATSTNDDLKPYRNDNIGVLVVAGAVATGTKIINLKAQDYTAGAIGASAFTKFIMSFDGNAALTSGGATAGGANAPSLADYVYNSYTKAR